MRPESSKKRPGWKSFAGSHIGFAERLAEGFRSGKRMVVAAPPRSGLSEFLRHTDAFQPAGPDPQFVFQFVFTNGETAKDAARRFAREFLTGYISFSRNEPQPIIGAWPAAEILQLAGVNDRRWIARAIERSSADGEAAAMQNVSILELAANAGRRFGVVIDDVHNIAFEPEGPQLIGALVWLSEALRFPLVVAGRRRSIPENSIDQRIELKRLVAGDGARFAAEIANEHALKLDDASIDLLVTQTGGRPGLISDIIKRLAADDRQFDGFASIQRSYCEEIFGGRFGIWFDNVLNDAFNTADRRGVLQIFGHGGGDAEPMSLSLFQEATGLADEDIFRAASVMNSAELVNGSVNSCERSNDAAIGDLFTSRFRMEVRSEPRALVFASMAASTVSRSTRLMAGTYRQMTAIGVKDVLASFDGRKLPGVLFDPIRFALEFKGKPRIELIGDLQNEAEQIELPNIVFSASIESIYPQIAAQLSEERGAFAVGFPKHRFGDGDRVYWLAAEIDSKLPADAELVEFWCDRLEAAAVSAGLDNFKLWLITPDGFDNDACEVLNRRNAVGSSRMQADLILEILKDEKSAAAETGDEEMAEYEIVIPMSSESELIAAHTIEEIAKRHGFKAHDINQIKTALVEACINAVEHSHSPDRRIRQKFTVGQDKITIDVSNRGLRLADAPRPAADSARRGWGLKLMEKLMDEVTINDTDDGTSITMVKQLKAA